MPLDTDFIQFSREMKPTKQCKISQKNLRSDQGGGRSHPPPLKYATACRQHVLTAAGAYHVYSVIKLPLRGLATARQQIANGIG